jgi:hypothetical protein
VPIAAKTFADTKNDEYEKELRKELSRILYEYRDGSPEYRRTILREMDVAGRQFGGEIEECWKVFARTLIQHFGGAI